MSKAVTKNNGRDGGTGPTLEHMYKEYFLDYASYVILERAVPAMNDGLKPVQRRILHSLKDKDDGRYNKVANVIGHTMQYHPHGDAAIGAAMVKLGQKDLLIDTQGNWGDVRTGDSAAAPRYIEARLTKFALEVLFNPQTTDWQVSYDGRNKEPITLPAKFPLVLAQGVEGIAVGLSTKILPHNFIELIKASIKSLQGKKVKIYPDFQTGGSIDITDYQSGKRGGKVKVRAQIEKVDKKTLKITELPYAVTTTSLIDSILKANEKGKIKVKKVMDNTAKDVEILLELPTGVSPDVMVDALYAFTNCEISISPNACVILDNKPVFVTVEEILKISAENTKQLLKQELQIKLGELEQKWHMASLEKIFIEKRIYRDIEEAESFEEVIKIIHKGLRKYVATPKDKGVGATKKIKLKREITEEDIIKLTEIRIKRISKYNKFKATELLDNLSAEMKQVKYDLKNLTDYAIAFYTRLLEKYGKGRERRTKIATFDSIKAKAVVSQNAKLYVNRKEGFVGRGMKKDEFVADCSDIDDIIAFTQAGKFKVVRISDKDFIGKNILHAAVWKSGDDRTTYNMIYLDKKTGMTRAKRFNVSAITRNKEYDLTKGNPSKVVYFSANLWMDEVSGRINTQKRGKALGSFDTGNEILAIYKDGTYQINEMEVDKKYDIEKLLYIGKFDQDQPINAVYFSGDKKWTMAKRFFIETITLDTPYKFISESAQSKLYFVGVGEESTVVYSIKKNKKMEEYELDLHDFVDIKGWKSLGNKMGEFKIIKIATLAEVEALEAADADDEEPELFEKKPAAKKTAKKPSTKKTTKKTSSKKGKSGLTPGDTIEFDF